MAALDGDAEDDSVIVDQSDGEEDRRPVRDGSRSRKPGPPAEPAWRRRGADDGERMRIAAGCRRFPPTVAKLTVQPAKAASSSTLAPSGASSATVRPNSPH